MWPYIEGNLCDLISSGPPPVGDVGFVGWEPFGYADTQTLAGVVPSGGSSSDYLLAHIYWDAATAADVPAAPAGWTLIGSSPSAGGLKGALYQAPATAAAPTWQFTNSGTPTACYNGGDMGRYSGVDPNNPYLNVAFSVNWASGSAGVAVASEPVQIQAGCWLVGGCAPYSVSDQTYTTPVGLTQRSSSSPMGWFDSDGPAPAANATWSSTATISETYVGFTIALNPVNGGLGTPGPQWTLLGQSLDYVSAAPTLTNADAAIPAGAYLRFRASDTGYGGVAGSITSVSGGGLEWTELHDSGDQVNGSNHIRQSVWGAPVPAAIAKGALTVTAAHTEGTSSPTASIDLGMVTNTAGVDVSAHADTSITSVNQSAGIAVTGAKAGDLLVGAFMGYATDAGGEPVAAGQLQTLSGLSEPTTSPPCQTWVVMDGPTVSGTNVLETNWGNTNAALAPYIAWAETWLPA